MSYEIFAFLYFVFLARGGEISFAVLHNKMVPRHYHIHCKIASFFSQRTILDNIPHCSALLQQHLLAPTGALVLMMVYYISATQLFQIFTQSLDAIDVTSVTLSCLNSINAIDVTRYLEDILGIF